MRSAGITSMRESAAREVRGASAMAAAVAALT
jgi:hypothetical protein